MIKTRNRMLRRGVLAFTAATISIGLALSSAAFASSSSRDSAPPSVKPTIVFVHGGWADSSGWNQEVTHFERLGYPVLAPANPLRLLSSDAAYIHSVLLTISGPIILVGHSYGGAVITNAAVGVPNVTALVYIAAFAPDNGESLIQLVTMNPGTEITPQTLTTRPYPLPGGGQGTDLYIKQSAFHDAFAGDLPLKLTNQMWAEQRPFAQEAFTAKSGDPAWNTIPSWYMVATEDHAIPPATEVFMAERAHAHIVEVPASHVAMISQPKATIDLILAAIKAVG
jgi:pimeloyl-ACP methyl ester carboxylesterase